MFDSLFDGITEYIKEILISGIMSNLGGIFDSVNTEVGGIATQVGTTPGNFSPAIFNMIRNLSETVIMPVAGIILTFICCYELISMIIDHNNMHAIDTFMIFKWLFKTAAAVMIISNTFNITMAVFDVSQSVINSSSGIITNTTAIDDSMIATLQTTIESYDTGVLLGIYLESFIVKFGFKIISIVIFIIVYGRMIEIYLMVSLAPIPFATFGNKEQSHMGQNYLRSLFALGFQGFLILICVAIYAVLIHNIPTSADVMDTIWGILGYSILLCFTLLKTGNLAKSIFSAH